MLEVQRLRRRWLLRPTMRFVYAVTLRPGSPSNPPGSHLVYEMSTSTNAIVIASSNSALMIVSCSQSGLFALESQHKFASSHSMILVTQEVHV